MRHSEDWEQDVYEAAIDLGVDPRTYRAAVLEAEAEREIDAIEWERGW